MKLFLTSSPNGCPFDGIDHGPGLSEDNGFAQHFSSFWPSEGANVLFIASDPDLTTRNHGMQEGLKATFTASGLKLNSAIMCERANASDFPSLLADSQVVVLCGGHVPTMNRFLMELNAPELMKNYEGVVLGISAGTMNCAAEVYAQPEEEGEAVDPSYERFISGLGLTDIRILPHFQFIRDHKVDGLRIVEDITIPVTEC